MTSVKLRRNEELDLIFELTSRGWSSGKPELYPAGAVRSADEAMEFRHTSGWIGVARGVIWRGERSTAKGPADAETVERYSAHSVELDLQRQVKASHVIEWISNVPDGFIWNEPIRFTTTTSFTKSVGSGESQIRMTGSAKSGGGSQALHLQVEDIDLYVMQSVERDERDKRVGQIVYRTCADQPFRDKVRTCLSFALGKPIVTSGIQTIVASGLQPS